jgi:hypothetical protein
MKFRTKGKPDFYISSGDVIEANDFHRPKACFKLRRLQNKHRDQLLLLHIDPPMTEEAISIPERFRAQYPFQINQNRIIVTPHN